MPLSMNDRLNIESEVWRPDLEPKHPNPVSGVIDDISTFEGEFGAVPVLGVIDDSGKEWRVFCFGSVLQNRVVETKPEVGDTIGIKYLGKEKSRNFSNDYRNYKVIVEKADKKAAAPDWAALQAAAEKATAAEAEEDF